MRAAARWSSLGAAILMTAAFAPRAGAQGYKMDQPLYIVANADRDSIVADWAIGDMDGDGLADIVLTTTLATDPDGSGPLPRTGAVQVLLQRKEGFDLPIVVPVTCTPGDLILMQTEPDAGVEALFSCSTDSYTERVRGFMVLDMHADHGIALRPRQEDPDLGVTPLTVVDADQDGREDLFYSFPNDDNTTPGYEYRYVVWYNRDGAFAKYRSAPFLYSGITLPDVAMHPSMERVDVDGDGALDGVQGYCPGECAELQEPYKQMVATSFAPAGQQLLFAQYGDLDGDGLPDRMSSDWSTQKVFIQLQTAPLAFEDVGAISPIFLPGPATIGDLDLNGLADIALTDEKAFVLFLQDTPGAFHNAGQGLLSYGMDGKFQRADLNDDLCPDLLGLQRSSDGVAFFQFFRGLRCNDPGDLAVAAEWKDWGFQVRVSQVAGKKSFADEVVRVSVAAAVKDDRSLALAIQPPTGCTPVAARAPRHVYDCLLPSIAPGAEQRLPFAAARTKFVSGAVDAQVTAWLKDDAGDARPGNNRAFATTILDQRVRPNAGSPAAIEALK